jgi:hypothetical protein
MLHSFLNHLPHWDRTDWTVLAQTAMLDGEVMAILAVSVVIGAAFYLVASVRVGTLRARAKE